VRSSVRTVKKVIGPTGSCLHQFQPCPMCSSGAIKPGVRFSSWKLAGDRLPHPARFNRRIRQSGTRHEEIGEMAAGARGDDGRDRDFKRTHPRPRRCAKYHELAGLSAAASGIEAAGGAAQRADVFCPSAHIAASASPLICAAGHTRYFAPRCRHPSTSLCVLDKCRTRAAPWPRHSAAH
jgi:hypothetical protein